MFRVQSLSLWLDELVLFTVQCLGSVIGSNYHPNMKPAESSAETPPPLWWRRSHHHLRMEVHSQGHLEASVRFEIVFELVVGERAGYRRMGWYQSSMFAPCSHTGPPLSVLIFTASPCSLSHLPATWTDRVLPQLEIRHEQGLV